MVPFIIRIWHTLLSFYQLRNFLGARGEIGKHSRLKICRPHGLAGSSPAERTTHFYFCNLLNNSQKTILIHADLTGFQNIRIPTFNCLENLPGTLAFCSLNDPHYKKNRTSLEIRL